MNLKNKVNDLAALMIGDGLRKSIERKVLFISVFGFIFHLLLIFLNHQGLLNSKLPLLNNPITAIYTPFSFILLYEVYLLVFFIQKSTSYYIGKQIEIVTLIIIRRVFYDIPKLNMNGDWLSEQNNVQFIFDLCTVILLFLIIYFFNRLSNTRQFPSNFKDGVPSESFLKFLYFKKIISISLVPILFVTAAISFSHWIYDLVYNYEVGMQEMKNLNSVFFHDFFSILIVTDVFLLLVSLFYSDHFHLIIRNSGYVISTILIKISFQAHGLGNNILILSSVCFAFLMLYIYNLYVKSEQDTKVHLTE